jgi:predicted alpha/beta superfamily hydrolase
MNTKTHTNGAMHCCALLEAKWSFAFIIFILLISNEAFAQIIDSSHMSGTEVKTFHSTILGEDRKIYIRTPTKMKAMETYPVVYVLDGGEHISMVSGQLQYLSESYMIVPSMIVVGIGNTDRVRDLTPTHSIIGANGKPGTSANAIGKTSGGGDKFLQFIKSELMPYVNGHYPTAPFNILYGHSLGGLMAIHCLINHPEYFNAYIAVSPSLQWDNEVMLKQASAHLQKQQAVNKFLFFSDANEDEKFHANQLLLDSILQQKQLTGLQYKRNFYPEETHTSEPVKAFYDGIRFIYPNWYLPYNSSAFKKTMSSDTIIKHYEMLSVKYQYKVTLPHDEMIQLARFLRKDPARIKDALELLLVNTKNFPASAIAHEQLADTYAMSNDHSNALKAYQRALALDPSNETLKQKLNTLK